MFNGWVKGEEPEMKTGKELSEGRLHPKSGPAEAGDPGEPECCPSS